MGPGELVHAPVWPYTSVRAQRYLMRKLCCLLAVFFLLAGCQRESPSNGTGALRNDKLDQSEGGAISSAPIVAAPASASLPTWASTTPPSSSEIDWSPLQLEHATLHVSCNLDYQRSDDVQLTDIGKESLRQALTTCAEQRLVRIRYRGRIDRGFVSVMERVTVTADQLGIEKRVLDLDSAGGQVEDAIRAGDFIGESHWTI